MESEPKLVLLRFSDNNPSGCAPQNSIRECEREKRMNLIIREYRQLELQNSWCILVFLVSFVKSLNLVMVACGLPTTLDV